MKSSILLGVAIALLSTTACQKRTEAPAAKAEPPKASTVDVVKESERSRHFTAVNRQLELGGSLYGYVDVDGDALKLAAGLRALLEQIAQSQPNIAPFVKQDFAAIFSSLGLTDVKAVGVSSVGDGSGFFRNRVFLYTPDGRHGLLAGLGGKPTSFAHIGLAPADTDLFAETEIDVPAVYRAVQEIVEKIGGTTTRNAMEDALQKAGQNAAISFVNLINGMKGRASLIVRLDPERNAKGPGGIVLPVFSFLMRVDGVAQTIEPALAKSPLFVASQNGSAHLYEWRQPLPLEGVKPVIAIEGGTLYLATTSAFLSECHDRQTGLAQAPEFRDALSHVGTEGNGLVYVAPRLFSRLRQLESMNAAAPEQMKSSLRFALSRLPSPNRPLVSVRTNLPDGILVRSYWDRSLKQDVAMIGVYNPVTIGVLAAMAIPAFQKVRTASQQKAVQNNLRQLAAAADQYYLEHGVHSTTYDQLVGPDKYIRAITPVAGENYRALRFVEGEPLSIQLRNGTVVEVQP